MDGSGRNPLLLLALVTLLLGQAATAVADAAAQSEADQKLIGKLNFFIYKVASAVAELRRLGCCVRLVMATWEECQSTTSALQMTAASTEQAHVSHAPQQKPAAGGCSVCCMSI
jgi:hypothetical protein